MNRESYQKYQLDESKEARLWKDAIIVFDTSALLDFYYYPKEIQKDIFEKIFKDRKVAGRLWIPFHVQFEYLKNRKGVIKKPIGEKYKPLRDKIEELKSTCSKVKKITEQIKEQTKKPDTHPYLPQEKIDSFIEFAGKLNQEVEQFKIELTKEIEIQEKEIKSLEDDDTILKAFEDSINVGEELPFEKIMEIVKEGKLRYEYHIPPGYMDLKEKKGTQIFGDLIIWKQILDFSEAENKSVIFICNDMKIDWCHEDLNSRIKSPREELIKEFNDNNNQEFWMYNQSQFLYEANKFVKSSMADSKIEGVSHVIDERNRRVQVEKIIERIYIKIENEIIEDVKRNISSDLVDTVSEKVSDDAFFEEADLMPPVIEKVSINKYSIEEIHGNFVTLELSGFIIFGIEGSYTDYSSATYDKEDSVWYNEKFLERHMRYVTDLTLQIDVNLLNGSFLNMKYYQLGNLEEKHY